MIYDDGYIITFLDSFQGLFSSFNPITVGAITSETTYTVKDGDSLFSIAEEKYKDTTYWYLLGEWNNIGDPITLETGTILKLPNFG